MRTLFAALGLMILISGCSRERLTETQGGGSFDLLQAETDMAAQVDYYQDLSQLAAVMDTSAALDTLVARLERDPEVLWASNVNTGVNVQWRSGLRGMITIRTWAHQMLSGAAGESAPKDLGAGIPSWAAQPNTYDGIYTTPTHRKSLYLAICYAEFRTHDDTVIDWGRAGLAGAGYDTFTVRTETQVDLAQLRSLASGEWGIVRISSHGAPYPSQTDIQDIYLLTGEPVSPQGDIDNEPGLANGTIGVNTYYGTNYYSVTPGYITQYNNFAATHPLFLNGFCYSHLGGWSTSLRSAGAGGVFGWDWECYAGTDAAYVNDMLTKMCAREAGTPYTLQRWYAKEDPWFSAGERTVRGYIAAADSFALWPPSNVRLESLQYPAAAPGNGMFLYGSGFGAAQGQIFFGTTAADPGPAYTWSDTQIYIVVPAGLAPGNTPVKVVTATGEESNTLTIYIQNELMDKLHESTRVEIFFSAEHTFDPGSLGMETAFSLMHQHLVWQENTFYGRETEVTSTRRLRMDIVGAIDLDAETCDLEYESADTVYTAEGGHVITYKKAAFRGVPLIGIGYGGASFGADGQGAVQNLVHGNLVYRRTTSGDVGSQFPCEYVRTDWDYGHPRLSFGFEF